MNSYDKIYNLLTEDLSMKARRALAGHRLIKKRPEGPLRNQMIIRARELKGEVPTNPKRDVVRAAVKATRDDKSKHQ
tara:strand:+ start:7449 stop:7679 length:231 start_codon:yes stop_codon:yes gene_type:complete